MPLKPKYRSSGNLKAVLFVIAVLIAFGLFYYSQMLINDLRVETREFVTFYAEVYAKIASAYEVDDFSFLFDQFIRTINFPVVISDPSGIPTDWKNLEVDPTDKNPGSIEKVTEIMRKMDEEAKPIDLVYRDAESGEEFVIALLHYGDSGLITRLRWLPLVEIAAGALFILLGLAGFQFIRRSERRLIWVGMAKETAHQLGTPISSLMGWIEMLEGGGTERLGNTLPEMRSDLKRLERVAQRFSQIGTGGGLKPVSLNDVIEGVVNYLKKRLPQKGKQVEISFVGGDLPEIALNRDLFEWAFENLIKNSADAIERDDGRIEISTLYHGRENEVVITVIDNGKGIHPRNKRDVFKPGYSTKKHGWGLGLSLTKRIIEDYHYGKLRLKDSRLGEGTIMEVVLRTGVRKT